MRVLHLINELCLGGAQTVVIDLANHFNCQIGVPAVCTLVPKGTLASRLDKDITLFEMNKRKGNDPLLPLHLSKIFRQWRPDVVHTHCWGSLIEGFIGAKLANVPIIVHTEHGTIENRKRNVYVQKALWHCHNQIIAVSKEHKQRLISTIDFPGKKIQVVYNGIDTNQFTELSAEKRKEKRKCLGYSDKDLIVGTVGRLEPVKDQANLLRAFKEVHRKLPNTKLLMVGDGGLRDELLALSYSLAINKSVSFLGLRDDVAELMGIMDLFVLPSKSEGASCTLLEAMSCKQPVVATEVGGNPEIVRINETGLLVPKEDPGKLAGAIKNLLCDQSMLKKMGQKGRNRVEAKFSVNTMSAAYTNMYQSIPKIRKML